MSGRARSVRWRRGKPWSHGTVLAKGLGQKRHEDKSEQRRHSTTNGTFRGPDPEPPPPQLPANEPTGISWKWVVGGTFTVLLAAAVLLAAFGPQSWIGDEKYILAPGSATDTASAIIIDGAPSFPPEGEIAFTTVSIRRDITIGEWFLSRFDDADELVPAESIDGTRTSEETRQVTQFQMDQSQDTATLVALNYLGYEIVPEVEGPSCSRSCRAAPLRRC